MNSVVGFLCHFLSCTFPIGRSIEFPRGKYYLSSVSLICRKQIGSHREMYLLAANCAPRIRSEFQPVHIIHVFRSSVFAFLLLVTCLQPCRKWCKRAFEHERKQTLSAENREWRIQASDQQCGRTLLTYVDYLLMSHATAWRLHSLTCLTTLLSFFRIAQRAIKCVRVSSSCCFLRCLIGCRRSPALLC